MPWIIEYEEKNGILYTEMKGHLTGEEVHRHAIESITEMNRHKTLCALVDLRKLEGGVSVTDLYELPVTYEKAGLPRNSKLAILGVFGFLREDNLNFYQNLCRNMGFMVKVFMDEESARKWLLGNK